MSAETPATPDNSRPPRDGLVRVRAGLELRDTEGDGPPVLYGHFARFDEWTEIDSLFEGHFMERIAPGAFSKTFKEQAPQVLLNHGRDPDLGDKPLGRTQELREDERGAYYEVELFRGIPDLVMDGLKAGQYGASFRFSVMREEFDKEPDKSDHNPDGIPERTVKEVRVPEFGPVTFPAYKGATAGVRSLTDEWLRMVLHADMRREFFDSLMRNPDHIAELRELLKETDPEPKAREKDEETPAPPKATPGKPPTSPMGAAPRRQ